MIRVGSKEIKVVCNGATPLFYRRLLKRDIFVDIEKLEKLQDEEAEILNMEIMENLLYVMAYQVDSSIGTLEEFLSQFNTNDVVLATDDILSLWSENMTTIEEFKKK